MRRNGRKQSDTLDMHIEGWRANIPIIRTMVTSASIILSVAWFTWQGSQWMYDIKSEMREMRASVTAITKTLDDKVGIREVDHRFDLMCARAPPSSKVWVCAANRT